MGYRETESGSPRLYRHTSTGGTRQPLLTVEPAAWPPFPRPAHGNSEEANEGPRPAKIPGRWKRRQPCPPSRAECNSSDASGEQARTSHGEPGIGATRTGRRADYRLTKGGTLVAVRPVREGGEALEGHRESGESSKYHHQACRRILWYYVAEPRGCKPGSRGGSSAVASRGGRPSASTSRMEGPVIAGPPPWRHWVPALRIIASLPKPSNAPGVGAPGMPRPFRKRSQRHVASEIPLRDSRRPGPRPGPVANRESGFGHGGSLGGPVDVAEGWRIRSSPAPFANPRRGGLEAGVEWWELL